MGYVQEHLPELLGDVLLKPLSPEYEGEQRVIAKIRTGLAPATGVALVGYAHGLEDSAGVRDLVASAGKETLDSWNDGELLIRKLAAAVVLDLLDGYVGDTVVAMAFATEAARILGLTPIVSQLPSFGERALVRLADQRRVVSFGAPPSVQPFPARGKVVELPPDDANGVTNTVLRNHLQAERAAIRSAAEATETRIARLEMLARRNSEEIDLLWWLLTPNTEHLTDWRLGGEASTTVAALEVARRLLTEPPPRGTLQILKAALTKAGADPDEEVSFDAIVRAAPPDLLAEPPVVEGPGAWSTPVLSAIRNQQTGAQSVSEIVAPRVRWSLQLVYDLGLSRVLG